MTKSFEELYPTLAVFEGHVRGILNIIKAADIYAQHIIASYRNTGTEKNLIEKILKCNAVSRLAFDGWSYRKDELVVLEEKGHMRDIGQQIVVATYTALEVYLIEKYKEYYRYILKDKDADFVENSLKRFSFRNVEEIKKHYSDVLKIHLPSFNTEYFTTEKCNWRPKDCWEAILLLEKVRNQIAHTGRSIDYKIITLMDSWYPFDFVCEWVRTFDVEVDHMIYRGKESAIIKEYKDRLAKQSTKKSEKKTR
ncbi:MAG TPA: hypothetical protein VN328_07350 [Thermodesulfovibrionales bacterium]|nr:hypothetical protein [Thermodesulfovibrionales bacterium]